MMSCPSEKQFSAVRALGLHAPQSRDFHVNSGIVARPPLLCKFELLEEISVNMDHALSHVVPHVLSWQGVPDPLCGP